MSVTWPTRQRIIRLLLLVATVGSLSYAASWYRDFGLYHLLNHRVTRDVVEFEHQLQAAGLPVEKLGDVYYDGKALSMLAAHRQSHEPHAPTVCLMGSIHGNEPAGAAALLSLAKNLAAQPQQFADLNYALLPLVNPWGWSHDLRHNGNNLDVARRFNQSDAQEAEIVKHWLTKERCALLVDLHEDRVQHGFYALDYASPKPQAIEAVIQHIAVTTGIAHASHPKNGVWRIEEKDFADISRPTASLWARQNGIPLALIVETFDGLTMAQRVSIHHQAITAFVGLVRPQTTAEHGQ